MNTNASSSPALSNSAERAIQSREETAAIFRSLRRLKASLGPNPNKHDLAIIMIIGCIELGLDRGTRIVKALGTLGLNQAHAGMILTQELEVDPAQRRWNRDSGGRYYLVPCPLASALPVMP